MKMIRICLVLLAFTISPAFAEGEKYTCPMHPHYIATEMGTCPICGMDLVPVEGDEESEHEDHSAHNGPSRKSVTIAPATALTGQLNKLSTDLSTESVDKPGWRYCYFRSR